MKETFLLIMSLLTACINLTKTLIELFLFYKKNKNDN